MQRKIITTADGSKTIHIEGWNEQYHSVHGAIQEANHVYIKHGLLFYLNLNHQQQQKDVSILEIGFGTGLNALLTLLKAEELNQKINYVGVEAYPITSEEMHELNYASHLNIAPSKYQRLHTCDWETQNQISEVFQLEKQKKFIKHISEENTYDIIYFDAFGARVQPELWTDPIFNLMYKALRLNGVLTTYAAIGRVRRSMQSLGFEVERLEGPPGKRHMIRAVKR